MALPRNKEPVTTLQQLSEIAQIEKPKNLEGMAQKLWHLGIPHRIIQLPALWWQQENQVEAGVFLAPDLDEPGLWWFIRITATQQHIKPLSKTKQAAPTWAELTTRVLSLGPPYQLPLPKSGQSSAGISTYNRNRSAVPAAVNAALGIVRAGLLGLVAGQLDNNIATIIAALVVLLGPFLTTNGVVIGSIAASTKESHRINSMMQLLELPVSNLRSLGNLQQHPSNKPPAAWRFLATKSSVASTQPIRPHIFLVTAVAAQPRGALVCLICSTSLANTQHNPNKAEVAHHKGISQQRTEELLEINENIRLGGRGNTGILLVETKARWLQASCALDVQESVVTAVSLGAAAIVLWTALQLPEQNEQLIALTIRHATGKHRRSQLNLVSCNN